MMHGQKNIKLPWPKSLRPKQIPHGLV